MKKHENSMQKLSK